MLLLIITLTLFIFILGCESQLGPGGSSQKIVSIEEIEESRVFYNTKATDVINNYLPTETLATLENGKEIKRLVG